MSLTRYKKYNWQVITPQTRKSIHHCAAICYEEHNNILFHQGSQPLGYRFLCISQSSRQAAVKANLSWLLVLMFFRLSNVCVKPGWTSAVTTATSTEKHSTRYYLPKTCLLVDEIVNLTSTCYCIVNRVSYREDMSLTDIILTLYSLSD